MQCDGIEGSNSKMTPTSSVKAHSLNLNKLAYRPSCISKFLFSSHTCLQYSQEGRAADGSINDNDYFIKC